MFDFFLLFGSLQINQMEPAAGSATWLNFHSSKKFNLESEIRQKWLFDFFGTFRGFQKTLMEPVAALPLCFIFAQSIE